MFDIPGLVTGAASGKGRGKEVLAVLRNAELLLIIGDALKLEQIDKIKNELYDAGIRMNEAPPKVAVEKKIKGGIYISKPPGCQLSDNEIMSVLNEFGYHSADVTIKENITIDQLIDHVAGNRKYAKTLFLVNKVDLLKGRSSLNPDYIQISAEDGEGLDNLRERIYQKLGFIRIYLKPPGREPDFINPLILPAGATILDVCNKLHRDFKNRFKWALVTGKSVKFKDQRVGINHALKDEDIITVVVRE